VLTDRFARNDGSQDGCGNLGWYCGGGYVGLKNNLDYIQGMGFDAIWISPIIKNRDGGYHGYWGTNLYELNYNFGSEQDFVDFVNACHQRNIWVMVDVVANHMGNLDENFGGNVPFNSGEHYHGFCIISDNDFATKNQDRIENCRLASLADLKQENDWVRTKLLEWIRDLVQKYHIDGIRIDTVPEVPKWFWKQFQDAAGVYAVGEVFDGDMGYLAGYLGSLNAVLNYPFFFWVRDTVFNFKDMTNLRNYYNEWSKRVDGNKLNYLCNFVDNHDNARVLSWGGNWDDKKKHYKTINAMALTSVGIPIIYYGTEQYFAGGNDPQNR
jgi:alpha-amylase